MNKLCDKIMLRAIKFQPTPSDIKKFSINKDGRIRLHIDGNAFFKGDIKLFSFLCGKQDGLSIPVTGSDAIGLIIIKKMFSYFIEYMSKINEDEYNTKLVPNSHTHFTLQMCDNNVEITFHISILHDMMLENFKITQ